MTKGRERGRRCRERGGVAAGEKRKRKRTARAEGSDLGLGGERRLGRK